MLAYQRQRKMTVVLVAAFFLFLFCLTPWFVFYQVIDACPNCEDNKALEMYLFSIEESQLAVPQPRFKSEEEPALDIAWTRIQPQGNTAF
ncbi:hypothetical protein AC249_AIPGENE17771 [Exaiptasia diaphana]|nr:hypothetical protein AC249_AIPGENE17771 [Exaiptasia diaphana]